MFSACSDECHQIENEIIYEKRSVCLNDGQFRILRHDGIEVIGSISARGFIEEVTGGLHAERT